MRCYSMITKAGTLFAEDVRAPGNAEVLSLVLLSLVLIVVGLVSDWLVRKLWDRHELPPELHNMVFAHENLAEGESILHVGRFHPVNWHLRWVVYIALPTVAIAFPFLFWDSDPHVSGLFAFSIFCFLLLPLPWVLYLNCCYAYNKVYKTEFVLTNKRLITKKGFMRTVVREIQLRKVESVDYGQTFLESWFQVKKNFFYRLL